MDTTKLQEELDRVGAARRNAIDKYYKATFAGEDTELLKAEVMQLNDRFVKLTEDLVALFRPMP